MKKILIIPILTLFCFTLISCDPGISYEYYVENNSGKDLIFQFPNRRTSKGDTIKMSFTGATTLITGISVHGSKPHDEGNEFLHVIDTLYVMTIDSFQISKELYNRENWTYARDLENFGLIKVGTNKYLIEIEKDDILQSKVQHTK